MNAKNINEILDALAARLSVPASHLWAVLVRQAAVEFWTIFAAMLVVFALTAAAYGLLRVAVRKDADYDEPPAFFAMLALILLGVGSAIMAVVTVSHIGLLINPEYYALQEVLGALK